MYLNHHQSLCNAYVPRHETRVSSIFKNCSSYRSTHVVFITSKLYEIIKLGIYLKWEHELEYTEHY